MCDCLISLFGRAVVFDNFEVEARRSEASSSSIVTQSVSSKPLSTEVRIGEDREPSDEAVSSTTVTRTGCCGKGDWLLVSARVTAAPVSSSSSPEETNSTILSLSSLISSTLRAESMSNTEEEALVLFALVSRILRSLTFTSMLSSFSDEIFIFKLARERT